MKIWFLRAAPSPRKKKRIKWRYHQQVSVLGPPGGPPCPRGFKSFSNLRRGHQKMALEDLFRTTGKKQRIK